MPIASEAVKVSVISSLALASVEVLLSDAIETLLKVGAVVSVVTLPLPLVTAVLHCQLVSPKAMLYHRTIGITGVRCINRRPGIPTGVAINNRPISNRISSRAEGDCWSGYLAGCER